MLLLFLIQSKRNRRVVNLLALIILIVFSGLSYTNGWDWYGYKDYYDGIGIRGFSEVQALSTYGIEFFFLMFMYVTSLSGLSFVFFVFINAVITNTIIYLALKKLNVNYILFIIMYFCVSYLRLELSTLRQGLAVAICIYSLSYILEKRKLKFIVLVIVASLFHRSALVLLAFYPFLVINISLRKHFYIMALAIPVSLLAGYLSTLLSQTYMIFYNEWTKFFIIKLANYLALSRGASINFQSLILLVSYAFFAFQLKSDSKEKDLFLKIMAMEVIVVFYFSFLPQLVIIRLIYYFQVGWLALCVLSYYNGIKPKGLYLSVLIAVIICKLLLNFRYTFDRDVYFPYYNSISSYFYDDSYGRSREFLLNKAGEAEEVR